MTGSDDRTPVAGERAPRRPDASMDLLRTVTETALEPGYRPPAPGRPRHRVVLTVTLVLLGLLLGLAFGATTRAAPEGADERARLIERIRQFETEQDAQRDRINQLGAENAELERQVAGMDPAASQLLQQLAIAAGTAAVAGPGVRITGPRARRASAGCWTPTCGSSSTRCGRPVPKPWR